MMPKRIQRKRTKGWKMPPNTVYVGRGSKWGNPYKAGPFPNDLTHIKLHKKLMIALNKSPSTIGIDFRHDLAKLRGKNLACWCKPSDPCHADVLLELANA